MDVLVRQPFGGHRLHGLRLADLLGLEPVPGGHVEEVGIAAGVELIGPIELDPALGEQVGQHAMDDGGADLRLDVIADQRDAGRLETRRPFGIAGDEDGNGVDEGHARFQRALGVELCRLLRSDRQVVDHDVGAGLAQRGDHLVPIGFGLIGGHEGPLVDMIGHMIGHAVQRSPHLHLGSGRRHLLAKCLRAVGPGEYRVGHVAPDLALVDIPGGDDADIGGPVSRQLQVHEPGHVVGARPVMRDALHQRGGAIADADDGEMDRPLRRQHGPSPR